MLLKPTINVEFNKRYQSKIIFRDPESPGKRRFHIKSTVAVPHLKIEQSNLTQTKGLETTLRRTKSYLKDKGTDNRDSESHGTQTAFEPKTIRPTQKSFYDYGGLESLDSTDNNRDTLGVINSALFNHRKDEPYNDYESPRFASKARSKSRIKDSRHPSVDKGGVYGSRVYNNKAIIHRKSIDF